ncbi:MAG TPA: hypothetical protein PLI83_06805, partial [Thermomonas sp.]|nr:hypothetical protein [Thermomonas sp.]
MKSAGIALACVLAMAGCERAPPPQATPDEAAQLQAALKQYAHDQFMWRGRRVIDLSRADGWTSLVGMHWLDPGAHRVGRDVDNGIRLAMGPEHLGVFTVRDGKASFVADVPVTLDGKPARGGVLRSDKDPAGPSVIAFDEGKGLVTVIERGGRLALRVKHADAPSRVHFAGLEYWPGGRDWQVPARFIAHPAGKTLPIANIIGTIDQIPNPGALEFQRDGKTYYVVVEGSGTFNLAVTYSASVCGDGFVASDEECEAPTPFCVPPGQPNACTSTAPDAAAEACPGKTMAVPAGVTNVSSSAGDLTTINYADDLTASCGGSGG